MEEFSKIYEACLNEESENRKRDVQDNKCFLELLGWMTERLK